MIGFFGGITEVEVLRGENPYETLVHGLEVTIFNGRRSMHRVRASYGAQTRILAILSYDTQASVNQTRPDLDAWYWNILKQMISASRWSLSYDRDFMMV